MHDAWHSSSVQDVALSICQGTIKTLMAAVGWWTVWVHYDAPLPQMPFRDVVALSPPAYAYHSVATVVLVTTVDVVWHWNSAVSSLVHHAVTLVATGMCVACGGFGLTLVSVMCITETVAPCYALLKLRHHVRWLAHDTTVLSLRGLAVAVNIGVRANTCAWLVTSGVTVLYEEYFVRRLDTSTLVVCAWSGMSACVMIGLDALWSSHLLGRMLAPPKTRAPKAPSRHTPTTATSSSLSYGYPTASSVARAAS